MSKSRSNKCNKSQENATENKEYGILSKNYNGDKVSSSEFKLVSTRKVKYLWEPGRSKV